MSQHDYNLADQAGAAFRADLNSALAAIVSQNSGATEPAATFAYQWWADTTSGRLKQRNAANSAWLDRGPLAAVYATFGELVKFVKGADIASAATVDLGTATGNTVDVTHSTGTTAITSLGGASLQAGTEIETRFVISGGTLTLTHHATNLYLAGGANITLANGDVIRWRKMHSSNAEWKMVGGKLPASQAEAEAGTDNGRDMTPLRVAQAIAALGSSAALDSPITMATGSPAIIEISTSIPAGTKRIDIGVAGGSTNSTSNWLIQIGDSGGFETTGYSSGATNDNGTRVTSTAGFIVTNAEAAALSWSGVITLLLIDAANNTWVESGHLTDVGSGADSESGGHKSLSGELTSIRWTTVGGTAVADAGTLAIQYS